MCSFESFDLTQIYTYLSIEMYDAAIIDKQTTCSRVIKESLFVKTFFEKTISDVE